MPNASFPPRCFMIAKREVVPVLLGKKSHKIPKFQELARKVVLGLVY